MILHSNFYLVLLKFYVRWQRKKTNASSLHLLLQSWACLQLGDCYRRLGDEASLTPLGCRLRSHRGFILDCGYGSEG